MQVNNCTEPKPSFGMALRIKPEAVKSLKEMSKEQIDKLAKVGEELKDTKFYHLEVGEGGKTKVISPYANKYEGGFVVSPRGDEYLQYSTTWAGTEVNGHKKGDKYYGYIEFANNAAAKRAYESLRKSVGIERDAKMVQYLDAEAVRKDNAMKAARNEKSAIGQMVDGLFDKFGVKAI